MMHVDSNHLSPLCPGEPAPAHPFVGHAFTEAASEASCLSWRVATVLGNPADPLTQERWDYFADDPEEPPGSSMAAGWHQGVIDNCRSSLDRWVELLEPHKVCLSYLYAANPHLDLHMHVDETLDELLRLGRLDGFEALRARATKHYRGGPDGCRAKCAPASNTASP